MFPSLQTLFLICTSILITFAHTRPVIHQEQSKCPHYESQTKRRNDVDPSLGRYALPFQRPTAGCRTYNSSEVEEAIARLKPKIADPDLYRLFENAFPNTLDTMIKWKGFAWKNETLEDAGGFTDEDLAFVITGDM